MTWRARLRRWGLRALVVILLPVVFRLGWHIAFEADARALIDARAESHVVARRDYLSSMLDSYANGAAPSDSQFSGEWAIVTLSMTAAAAAGAGFDYPGTVPSDLSLAERACRLAMEPKARAFDTARWGADALEALDTADAHLGYLGHLGMALEAYRLLGGTDAELLSMESKIVTALTWRIRDAPFPFLPTYPNERYVADNAVALAVLGLSDVGRAATHAALGKRAVDHARAHLTDRATGLLMFGVDGEGGGTGGARASGAAWSVYYLFFVDEAFAKEQAEALRGHFRKKLWPGAEAVCERTSCDGASDVDSGPLVWGTSPAATGFAIAAARRLGDSDWLGGLLSTAEWAGFTVPGNRSHYLLAPLVGEAIVLAMETSRRWDARYLHGAN